MTDSAPVDSASKSPSPSPRSGWPDGMQIVNDQYVAGNGGSIRDQGMLIEPTTSGFIHLAGEFERPHPLKRPSRKKRTLLTALKEAARALQEAEPAVTRADVFNAFVFPPGGKEGREVLARMGDDVRFAQFDIAILIECTDVDAAVAVRQGSAFSALMGLMDADTRNVHCVVAKNPKRIADVDHERNGIFLFNYFYFARANKEQSDNIDVLLGVWEYTAGWFTARANLTNSVPLQPLPGEPTRFSLINHCRWDRVTQILPHLVLRPSLRRFVLANFTANDLVAMPILYRLA